MDQSGIMRSKRSYSREGMVDTGQLTIQVQKDNDWGMKVENSEVIMLSLRTVLV